MNATQLLRLREFVPKNLRTSLSLSLSSSHETSRPPRYTALLVAINYLHIPEKELDGEGYGRLSGCIDDAQKVKELLLKEYNFLEDSITVMADDEDRHSQRYPTKENIITAIKAFVADARAGDFFVLYYAGHSDQSKAKLDKNEADGKDEYMVSCDMQIILDDQLHELLVDPLPSGTRLTAIFDACHSGTMLDLNHYCRNRDSIKRAPTMLAEGLLSDKKTIVNRRRHASELPRPKGLVFTFKTSKRTGIKLWRILLAVLKMMLRVKGRSRSAQAVAKVIQFAESSDIQFAASNVNIPSVALHSNVNIPEDPLPLGSTSGNTASATKTLRDPTPSAVSGAPTEQSTAYCPTCSRKLVSFRNGPLVISLSACLDSQTAGEDIQKKGGILTKALCTTLRKTPTCSTGELYTALQTDMFHVVLAQHKVVASWYNLKYGRDKAKKKFKRWVQDKGSLSWQRPEVGCESPLNMQEFFLLPRPDPTLDDNT